MFEISFFDQYRKLLLDILNESMSRLNSIVGNSNYESPYQYNCAIVVSIMKPWPAYAAKILSLLKKSMNL